MTNEKCPCGSGKSYADCCEKIIHGTEPASSAEALMRARYSAYAMREIDFIIDSTHSAQRESNDREEIRRWSENSEWLGLEILHTEKGQSADEDGTVEFVAKYKDHGVTMEHHELAEFRKEKGLWYFYDGKLVPQQSYVRSGEKIGRNDPCPCGSGKKYKKCCGK